MLKIRHAQRGVEIVRGDERESVAVVQKFSGKLDAQRGHGYDDWRDPVFGEPGVEILDEILHPPVKPIMAAIQIFPKRIRRSGDDTADVLDVPTRGLHLIRRFGPGLDPGRSDNEPKSQRGAAQVCGRARGYPVIDAAPDLSL